jgi:hypothetical protein
MSEKTSKPKRITKTKSFSVRFTQKVFDDICSEQGFEKAQQIVDYLEDLHKMSKGHILAAPTFQRNLTQKSQNVQKEPRKVVTEVLPVDNCRDQIQELELKIREAEAGVGKFTSNLNRQSSILDWKKQVKILYERLQKGQCDE